MDTETTKACSDAIVHASSTAEEKLAYLVGYLKGIIGGHTFYASIDINATRSILKDVGIEI